MREGYEIPKLGFYRCWFQGQSPFRPLSALPPRIATINARVSLRWRHAWCRSRDTPVGIIKNLCTNNVNVTHPCAFSGVLSGANSLCKPSCNRETDTCVSAVSCPVGCARDSADDASGPPQLPLGSYQRVDVGLLLRSENRSQLLLLVWKNHEKYERLKKMCKMSNTLFDSGVCKWSIKAPCDRLVTARGNPDDGAPAPSAVEV